jgi:hypothetical protein
MLRSAIPGQNHRVRYRRSSCIQWNGISPIRRRARLEHSRCNTHYPVRVSRHITSVPMRADFSAFSFHLDHAAALTYIMEKVKYHWFAVRIVSDHQLSRRISEMARAKST